MQKAALLGLGIMGQGLAGNLLSKGFELTVWNRTAAKAEVLTARGAKLADTPRQAAAGAEVVIAIVGDDAASRAVWLGADGALAGASPGAVLVECSTLSPGWVRELAGLAAEHGCDFLDAPIAGSKDAAANAQITLFAGGEAAALERARPALEAISRRVVHLGPTGAGTTWKLIYNMMIAVQVAALSEGLALAEAAGLDMEQVVPLILNGATGSRIVQAKLPRMVERRYDDTEFALKWMQKDARYAVELAQAAGVPLQTAAAAIAVMQAAREKGLDDRDFAAVIEGVRR
ncbi:MAG: NAD(P)-dependent oxidoreductase [Chloroflexi bacterium]|nr:NAD(P)-dependent oxidoreductase [Chloroflexota bacterium]MDL1886153.1 NAD(P)-dependent oxidoreductase [Anaerolineae bacterium CFX8]